MTLDGLRCFCSIIEVGSFHGAAKRTHRSQPAVSQQIRTLEEEIGNTLIERKTCSPTPTGQLLYERARHILNETESLARELEDFDEDEAGELRVGTSDTTAMYFLPPIVREFSDAMPKTHLVLINRSTAGIADAVLRGEIDLGIVTLPVGHDSLEEKDLFTEKLVLVAPLRHKFSHRKRVSLSQLSKEPFLLLEAETRTGALLQEHFQQEAFTPKTVLHSGSFEVIKRYVGEGVGLSFLPESVVKENDEGIVALQVPGLPKVRIGAIWRRGAYCTKAEKAFLELISR